MDEFRFAAYLTWHLRQALAALTFTDEHPPEHTNPIAPAADRKAATKHTSHGDEVRSFRDLLDHLATLTRNTLGGRCRWPRCELQ